MNRRQMLMIPGAAAAAASAALAEVPPHPPTVMGVSHKRVSKYGKSSEIYKVPKTAAKNTKYVAFLTTLLGLTTDQQQQITAIFTSAMQSQTTLRASMKTARQTLVTAVQNGDTNAIGQVTSGLGLLTAQHLAAGANANLQFLQILTPAQQALLVQFQS